MKTSPMKPATIAMLKIIEKRGSVTRGMYPPDEWQAELSTQTLDGLVRRRLVSHAHGIYRLTPAGVMIAAKLEMPPTPQWYLDRQAKWRKETDEMESLF